MLYEMIVSTIFKLINFFIIIGGSWIAFRMYFKQQLSEKIKEQESFIQELQEKTITLRREQHLIDERTVQDKKYAEVLSKKIDAWSYDIQQQKQEVAKNDEAIKNALKEKHDQQKNYLYKQELYKHIIPNAVTVAEEQLKQEYALQNRQEAFIQTIIQTMKHG